MKRSADDFLRDVVERAGHAAEHVAGMTKEQFIADRRTQWRGGQPGRQT
jgi:uncharacterized protein with HEPN domain